MIRAIAALTLTPLPTQGHADPCAAPVSGYRPGQVVSGLVWASIDGDGLCVGSSPDPGQWVEIRESRFNAPELNEKGGRAGKRAMDRLVGRRAVCTVERGRTGRWTSYDRLIASCLVGGVSIADHMARAGVVEGGR